MEGHVLNRWEKVEWVGGGEEEERGGVGEGEREKLMEIEGYFIVT